MPGQLRLALERQEGWNDVRAGPPTDPAPVMLVEDLHGNAGWAKRLI
jgi:hypothetical protein